MTVQNYQKPEVEIVEFETLEAIMQMPGMGGGSADASGGDLE